MNVEFPQFPYEQASTSFTLYDLFHKGVKEPTQVLNFNEIEGQYNGIKEIQSI